MYRGKHMIKGRVALPTNPRAAHPINHPTAQLTTPLTAHPTTLPTVRPTAHPNAHPTTHLANPHLTINPANPHPTIHLAIPHRTGQAIPHKGQVEAHPTSLVVGKGVTVEEMVGVTAGERSGTVRLTLETKHPPDPI